MTATVLVKQFQNKRDTALNWKATNPKLLAGELGMEIDTFQFKLGDGTNRWNVLPYAGGGGGSVPGANLDGGIPASKYGGTVGVDGSTPSVRPGQGFDGGNP